MPLKFRKTCEPSSGGIGIRLKKQSTQAQRRHLEQQIHATSEPNITATRADATSATARMTFIAGPAMAMSISSRQRWLRLPGLNGTGLAQPTKNLPTDGDAKIMINGSSTVPIGSMWTRGLSEQPALQPRRVVAAFPRRPRVGKLVERQQRTSPR